MNNTSFLSYIILSGAIIYAVTLPQWDSLTIAMDEKQKYENSLAQVAQIEERKNALLAQFNKISAEDRGKIESLLPNSFNFVKLVADMDAVGSRYNIDLSRVSSVSKDPSVGTNIDEGGPPAKYQSALINLVFTSTYDSFDNLLSHLEKSLRLLDVRNLKVVRDKNGKYQFDLVIETYWYK